MTLTTGAGNRQHAQITAYTCRSRPDHLPAGTVTFLLTDIEGSTVKWETDAVGMAAAVRRHYEILDAAIAAHGGIRPIEQGEGDSLVAAFPLASAAIGAALEAQRALSAERWRGPAVAVRMALHTDEAQIRDGRYYTGPSIIRCARLRALAHGGEALVSQSTAALVVGRLPDGASLVARGEYRLKGLRLPEQVFELRHGALPTRPASPSHDLAAPRSWSPTEIAELAALVARHLSDDAGQAGPIRSSMARSVPA